MSAGVMGWPYAVVLCVSLVCFTTLVLAVVLTAARSGK